MPRVLGLTVGIIGGNRLLREYLCALLKAEHAQVLYSVSTSEETNGFKSVDLLLIDANELKKSNVRTLVQRTLRPKIIVTNADPSNVDVVTCIRFGIAGFVLKDASSDDLVQTMCSVSSGARAMPPLIVNRLCDQLATASSDGLLTEARTEMLTFRERQIIRHVVNGLTNKEIAATLSIAPHTVKCHIHNILQKCALRKRIELLQHYLRDAP